MNDARGHLTPPLVPEAIVLGLGGNLGDRLDNLRQGLFALLSHPEIRVTGFSRVWETEYVGPGRQAPYLNLVATATTSLAPLALLAVCQGIEGRLGRMPGGHLLPRTLDIDILLYGDRRASDDALVLPHPRLAERGFVLGPLAELAPDLRLPDSGETAAAAWARIQGAGGHWLRPLSEPLFAADAVAAGEEEWRAALAVYCR
ncbi:MAG TPA: 2-amino-4-hydroxy-6-hydroxymethyldihydropteridine diphosphokinase [Candidatus Krumholzibacteria bacterium]|nr:2-amino-4-hydroxy-6-hydroxymethyldihydropteridine diphosphokinase [Candidatus Krumholzibacteria bacterium]HPD71766.1 2-amino-4-hydroxy-6-hydroxymethyldihydropteridine diphosphokinase [Candidatus Krumholzibacteria bacterium]HRY41301.1 2-amino-4-hydroxy-6-hydroxymethyldihydropteridine diphosphokinase [Candidatus Krumholzibacteria bacterium]